MTTTDSWEEEAAHVTAPWDIVKIVEFAEKAFESGRQAGLQEAVEALPKEGGYNCQECGAEGFNEALSQAKENILSRLNKKV